MQVSILEGVFESATANFRPSYPVNMQPVLGSNGISNGYLRTAPGITPLVSFASSDRGSIMWNGVHYRVMGSKLVSVLGAAVTTLGDVGNDGKPAALDYGFDRLMIASAGGLYYYKSGAVTQVTDVNLGTVLDACWIDGYYMTTDGTSLVVTELSDPYTVNPLKYGSSEADPDPIVAVQRVRDEIYAVNRDTIENFLNIGGTGFPFQRNPGGLIPKGACGTFAVAYFLDTLAFVGGGRDEALSVWLSGYGTATCLSTPEIDRELATLTLAQQAAVEVEGLQQLAEQRLFLHLPTKTLVYHHQASLAAQKPVWTELIGGVNLDLAYPGRHFANTYDQGIVCGNAGTGQLGILDPTVQTLLGQPTTWRFDTLFLYNQSRGAILKSAELVGAPGRAAMGVTPTAFMSWTQDGMVWSQERSISLGLNGQYQKRMQWRPKTRFANYMGLRFRGASPAVVSFARLEVEAEPLNA